MDINKVIGMVLLFTGVMDMLVYRSMGPKLPPQARTAILAFGLGFLGLGAAVLFGYVRLA